MKLYIKQKVFSIGAKFSVKDENGNDKYFVEGEILTLGRKLHIYDINNNEVAFVRQKLLTFMPKFTVEVGGELFAHDYVITSSNEEIVSIHKAWMSWGDTYEPDISDNNDEITALAVVLAIDTVLDSANNAANG